MQGHPGWPPKAQFSWKPCATSASPKMKSWTPWKTCSGSRLQSPLVSTIPYISSAFRNKTLDNRRPIQLYPSRTMRASHSLVSHFPAFQPSLTQQPLSYIHSHTGLGAGGRVRKEHLLLEGPVKHPPGMQVSYISSHLCPRAADSTKPHRSHLPAHTRLLR